MADEATLQARLEAAEDAEHRLATGALEVEVDYDGHAVKYARPNLGELRRYIRSLRRKLGQSGSNAGAARVTFS